MRLLVLPHHVAASLARQELVRKAWRPHVPASVSISKILHKKCLVHEWSGNGPFPQLLVDHVATIAELLRNNARTEPLQVQALLVSRLVWSDAYDKGVRI